MDNTSLNSTIISMRKVKTLLKKNGDSQDINLMENDNLIRDSVLKDARWSQQMGDNIKVIRKVCTKKDRRKVGKTKKKKKEKIAE